MRRFVLFLAVLSLVACSREERPAASKSPAPAVVDDTPQDGGTLIRRLDVDVATLNPIVATSRYDRYIANYLFTPLVYFDKELRPIAGLAESWDISDDGRRYTFHLNDKATFADGTPVRASDVIFTINKIVDPASEAVQIAGNFELLDRANTKAIDDHTVQVAFREALASQMIRFNDVLVLPEHIYAKGHFKNDFATRALGSGPYKLVRRTPGNEVVMERRADYWGTKPHIQTVIFKVIVDATTAWNALKRGDIDETMIVSDTWQRESRNPALQKTIDFRRFYTLNYNYVAWNTRDPLLSDKRIRRALSMCVPIDSVINDLYHGTARAMSGPFTPDEWAYNPDVPVIRYDPDAAKQMLMSIGWRDANGDGILDKAGKPLRVDMIIIPGSATTMQFAQMFQSELKKIGVQMELVTLDGAVAIQRLLGGNYQSTYLGWDLDPDPDQYGIFHSSQVPPRGQNFTFYTNAEADRLIEEGRRELDADKRRDIYHRLHAILAEDQPYTWTTQVSVKWALSRNLRGVDVSRGYGLYLWYPGELAWWIPKDQQRRGAGSAR